MALRDTNISKLDDGLFDVLVIGGGINGAVSAASLAARGVKVALIDRDDFSSDTSSNSSNLAWGGIKYLETFEFSLVNRLCRCRNQLMREYPSTVKEIRFLTTIQKGFRFHPFFVFLGTILYWIIGRFATRPPRYLSKRQIGRTESVINTDNAAGGFEYSDCYLYDNDARFVFNFIRSSMNYGCIAANYLESLGSSRENGIWVTRVRDQIGGREFTIRSRAIINACGPCVDQYNRLSNQLTDYRHVFSKGIHLMVDRVSPEERVLAFFASDGRLFFVIPMGSKTCLGTTDTQVQQPAVSVTDEDRHFVLENVSAMLKLEAPLQLADIIAERCGVRPLATRDEESVADWVQLSRQHKIEANSDDCYLSIFGGKLTDCLNVGDEVASIIDSFGIEVPSPERKWFGEPGVRIREEFMYQARLSGLDALTPPDSTEPLSERLWRRYGDKAIDMLEDIREDPAQAELLIENTEYIRCEIVEAAHSEMIVKLEDFLRRRSKISQVLRVAEIAQSPGLREACQILFGDQAEQRLQEFLLSAAPAR